MRILLGILKILSCTVYIIIILALMISTPMILGFQPVVILSGSMLPDYPIGGVTYYKQAEFSEIVVGDAITFQLGADSLATHRVVEIDEESKEFITKGDNNESADLNPVSYDRVQGKTSDIAIPYAGYFINYVKSVYVIIPCAMILILDLVFTKDKKGKQDRKSDKVKKEG